MGAPRTCLLTGSSGFIGSRVLSALRRAEIPARRLVRRPTDCAEDAVVGEVQDPGAIARAMRGTSTVIHCAAYLGTNPAQQQCVNVDGTRNVVVAAEAAGVSRIVYLSTSGVYGGRLGQGRPEGEIRIRPQTALSRSRADAEALVLRAGGMVVRPNIVYGPGDHRTITALLQVMASVSAWIGDPDARVSVISNQVLGTLIAALATTDAPPGVYHAGLPQPVAMRGMILPIFTAAGARPPTRSVTPALAAQRHPALTARQLGMVADENWYDSDKIWQTTRVPFPSTIMSPDAVAFYARELRRAFLAHTVKGCDT